MTFNEEKTSYLTTSSSDYAFRGKDFTVEAFFKAATASNSTTGIVSLRNFGATIGVSINIEKSNTSEPLIEFNVGGGKITYTASNDQWYHVAISKTGGTSSFFVNGNLLTSVNDYRSLYENVDLVVGRYYTDYNGYYFNGIISNVRVVRTGLYTGTFSIPSTPLSGTESNTKLLISSQEMNPTADLTGLHRLSASNIGWTSSIPYIDPPYITDHLELYVDAGVLSSYPGTGTTWYDISGNSRNLTMNNLSYSSNDGGYIIFDGSHTADSVTKYSINLSSGFTVECVAKFSGSGLEGLFAFNDSSNGDYINIQAQGNNVRWEVDQGSSFTSNISLSSNTWYHITCVYDGSSRGENGEGRIYINGVLDTRYKASASRVSSSQTSNFVLGLHDGYLNGNISLSRMYNRVLNIEEILKNFNATKNRYGL